MDTNNNRLVKWVGLGLLLIIVAVISFKLGQLGNTLQSDLSNSLKQDALSPTVPKIKPTAYSSSSEGEKKLFEVLHNKNSFYTTGSTTILYYDNSMALAVVPAQGMGNYPQNNLLVGFFRLNSTSSLHEVVSYENYPISCVNASFLRSSCSFVSPDYAAFVVAEGSVAGGDDSLLIYTPGSGWYNKEVFNSSSAYGQGGSYTKGYNEEHYRILESNFSTSTITLGVFKNNQDLGMGKVDLSKQNEKIKMTTYQIK